MRILTLLGLLLALVIVGTLFKRQLSAAGVSRPPAAAGNEVPSTNPDLNGKPRQVQEQYRHALEGALQQPARDVPAEAQ